MLKTSKLGLISWTKDKQVITNERVPNSTVMGTLAQSNCTNLASCFRVRIEKRHPVSDSKAKKYTLIGGTAPYGTYRDKKMWVLVQTTTFRPLLWCTNAVDEN